MSTGNLTIPVELLAPLIEDLEVPCCEGYAYNGPAGCHCWTVVLEPAPQAPVVVEAPVITTMPARCGDCAYRRDSPESRDAETAAQTSDDLVTLAVTGTVFWCHDGMPKVIGWTHPEVETVVPLPAGADDYHPRIVGPVPYRADGTPGSHCAGWSAAHARHLRQSESAS